MLFTNFNAPCRQPQIAFIFSKKQAVFSVIFAQKLAPPNPPRKGGL
jgi:hypothetical protein